MQYIAAYYHEDPDSYSTEYQQLEQLRSAAIRPTNDVNGVQTIKRYYCQLRYLRSRFPMEKGGLCSIQFSWKDAYAGVVCSASDLSLELMSVLYNIGALHSQLGASDSRQNPDGMKMACTHFQCAAWAFQQARELYPQQVALSLAPEVLHFMELSCLAQAQECILEKSMTDSRKCTIIAKVASQAVDYYHQAGQALTGSPTANHDNADLGDIIGGRIVKDWCRYLRFKSAYLGCVSLLFQGQCSEEQQKMGERCAFFQAASERLEEARKIASSGGKLAATCASGSSGGSAATAAAAADIEEALAFTQDVVEGKRKAARNENEFIYHEVVPERDALPTLQGASLVRPVPFGVQDPDVSGPDIFGRLVPMEAHEASSVYSERKAELLRSTVAAVEQRDRELEEFMGSLQHMDVLIDRLQRPQVVPQEVVDRAAALSARPQAAQQLIDAMGRLSAVHHDVDSLLTDAQAMIDHEREEALKGDRDAPPSMPMNDLARECAKYREALSKACESNEALHKAMMTHVANLKILGQPLSSVDKHIPRAALSEPQMDGPVLDELRKVLGKVDEMRQQRAQLMAELREAIRSDDITGRIVMQREKPAQELEQLFKSELSKHLPHVALIDQNLSAQQNILLALTDAYANVAPIRKNVTEQFRRRDQVVTALIASYDAYDDLLAKANKGIDFYQKLETNVNKLLQRLRSTCRVQQEEREQKSSAQNAPVQPAPSPQGPKLRDYLQQPRPAPLGSEHTDITKPVDLHPQYGYSYQQGKQPTIGAYPQVTPMVTAPMMYPTQNIPTQHPTSQYAAAARMQNPTSLPYTPDQSNYGHVPRVPPTQHPHPPATTNPSYSQPYNYYTQHHQIAQTHQPYSTTNFGTRAQTTQAYTGTQVYGGSQIYGSQQPIYGPQTAVSQGYNSQTSSSQGYGTLSSNSQGYGTISPNSQSYAVSTPNSQVYGTQLNPNFNNQMPCSQTYSSQTPSSAYTQLSGHSAQTSQPYPSQISTTQPYSTTALAYSSQVITTQAYGAPLPVTQAYSGQPHSNQPSTPSHSVQPQAYPPQTYQKYPVTSRSYPASYGVQQAIVSHANQPTIPLTNKPIVSHAAAQQVNPSQYTYSGQPAVTYSVQNPATTYLVQPNYPQGYQQKTLNPATTYQATPQQNIYGTQQKPGNQSEDLYNTQYGQQYSNQNIGYGTQQRPTSADSSRSASTSTIYSDENQPVSSPQQGSYNQPNVYAQQKYAYPQNQYANQVSVNTSYGQYYQNLRNPSSSTHVYNQSEKSSNIDLLSGLDFNVSQAPLDPVKATEIVSPITSEEQISVEMKESPLKSDPVEIEPEPVADTESFEKSIINLENWLCGPNADGELEKKWRELQQRQEKICSDLRISVARCYPNKNRCPDSLPYDHNRIELPVPPATDDYINASRIPSQCRGCPELLITQTPLQITGTDFWRMVIYEKCSTVICLATQEELTESGLPNGYWIQEFGAHMRASTENEFWIERIIAIDGATDVSVRHIQLKCQWPTISGETSIISSLVVLSKHLIENLDPSKCIVIHCLTGMGRSGVLSIALRAVVEQARNILTNVVDAATQLVNHRRNVLRDRLHLEIAQRVILRLAREKIPLPYNPEPVVEPEPVQECKDPLSDLDPLWKLKIS